MQPQRSSSPDSHALWLAVGVAAVIAVLRIPSFLRPILDDDEAQYAAIGELVRSGGRLYAEGGVDFKFPGIYWTYLAVFAVAGRYAMWAVHLLSLATVLGTALTLARIAGRYGAPRGGLWAALCYGVFSTVYYSKMLAANTELFMMLCISGAVLLLVSEAPGWFWRTLVAGALVGVACLYKQIAVLTLALPLLVTPRLGRAAVAGLGCVLVLLAATVVLAATGSLAGLWHWCVERLVGSYGSSAWKGSLLGNLARGFLPFLATSIVVWIGAGTAVVRGAPLVLVAWLVLSGASAAAGGHFFAHYFLQPLAPLSVLAALAFRRMSWPIVAGTTLPVAACFALAFVFEPITEAFGPPDPDYRVPVAWVRAHTEDSDRIFVWGVFPPMYVLAHRLPASRFVGFMRGAERSRDVPPEAGWDVGSEVWPALAEDFAAHPPAVIIDTSTADYMSFGHYPMARFPAMQALVDRDYLRAASPGGVSMYVRRPAPR